MMARIPGVPEESAPADVRAVYESARRKYGAVPTPVTLAAHHPEIFRAYMGFEGAFARAARVDARLTAMAAVKAAALVGCPF
jgi:alkylhydroperoxidase family enzyme